MAASDYPVTAQVPDPVSVFNITISSTQTDQPPGLVYGTPDVPPEMVQNSISDVPASTTTDSIASKQLIIYNDPRAALETLRNLGLRDIF
jgi:hypothetical protein